MSASDQLSDLQQKAQAQVDKDKQAEGTDQALVDQLKNLKQSFDDESEAKGKEQYAQGLKDGLAQAGKSGADLLYSQDDLDGKVKDAVDPVQAKLDDAQTQLGGRVQEVDRLNKQIADDKTAADKAAAEQGGKVAQLVGELKARIAAQIRSVDMNNETLAAQLQAESQAPNVPVDQSGTAVVEDPKPADVAVVPPVDGGDGPTKLVPDAPLADADQPSETKSSTEIATGDAGSMTQVPDDVQQQSAGADQAK